LLIDLNDGNESPASTPDRSVPTVNEFFDLMDLAELPRLPTEGALPERPNVAENTSLVANENVGLSSSINGLEPTQDGEPGAFELQDNGKPHIENKQIPDKPFQVGSSYPELTGEDDGEEEIMEIERGPTALEQLEKLLGL
jgi:hypothetical protein